MFERLLSGIFTKEQSFSGGDKTLDQKLHFRPLICDRRDDTNYVLDHTYALPIATQPYIIDNELFSIYSEIEIDYGCTSSLKILKVYPPRHYRHEGLTDKIECFNCSAMKPNVHYEPTMA
jgi:hypothetical protein